MSAAQGCPRRKATFEDVIEASRQMHGG